MSHFLLHFSTIAEKYQAYVDYCICFMINVKLCNKGLYCTIKLHEVKKEDFCNLHFIASSLVSFLMHEKKSFSLYLACNLYELNSFDILHYAFQISHQNSKSLQEVQERLQGKLNFFTQGQLCSCNQKIYQFHQYYVTRQ